LEKARNNSLDFLKIIATILIVFHHYQQALNVEFTQINFFGGKFYFGYLVELFFLISGFLMFNYIEKIKQGLNFESFFINRVKRFLPLVAIAAILYECLIYFYFRKNISLIFLYLFSSKIVLRHLFHIECRRYQTAKY